MEIKNQWLQIATGLFEKNEELIFQVDFQPHFPYSFGYSHSITISCSLKLGHNMHIPALIVHPKLQIIAFWAKHSTLVRGN